MIYQKAMKTWEDGAIWSLFPSFGRFFNHFFHHFVTFSIIFSSADKAVPGSTHSSGGGGGKAGAAGKSRTSKLCKAALAEFREAAKAGYYNEAGIHIMATLCLTKLQRWGDAVKEIKLAIGLIPASASNGDEPEWSFQGLDRARLVSMAVNLERMKQAQEKSAAVLLDQSQPQARPPPA